MVLVCYPKLIFYIRNAANGEPPIIPASTRQAKRRIQV
jgi:hypothetical protein